MAEVQERRAVPRTTLAGRPSARVPGVRGVHLLNLSLAGAQIEHFGLLRFGAACDLELPPPFGACRLPAQVVWCTVMGRTRTLGGESHLVARSGLWFPALTIAQHATLLGLLETARQPAA